MMAGRDGEVSTIFIAGLSLDALPRELENTMRFFPGYEGMKVAGSKGGGKGGGAMFVKFDYAENAEAATKVLNNVPFDLQYPTEVMRAEMARSDMKSPVSPAPRQVHTQAYTAYPAHQPPPPRHAPPPMSAYSVPMVATKYTQGQPPSKRPRGEEGGIDTLAVLGATEKGYSETAIEDFFQTQPGFICFKASKKVGGGFVKFQSPELAWEALQVAVESGLEVQMAKSSMSSPDVPKDGLEQYEHWQPAPPREMHYGGLQSDRGLHGPRAASSKRNGGASGVDTIILQGALEKGYTFDTLQDLFSQFSGFVAWKANPRVGGGFVKFIDALHASDAIEEARNHGIEAQMARNSMNAS